jgi:NADPH-dependent curcumin reductase CurA
MPTNHRILLDNRPQGLAAAPRAFLGLLKGRNVGKQLVRRV